MAGEPTRETQPDDDDASDSSAWRPLLLTLASGALYGLAYPPFGLAPLAWVALAPLFVALSGASWRRALALGWVWSVLAAWSVGEWMPEAVETYYLQSRFVGVLVFLGVATVMVAPYHMAFAVVLPRLASLARPRAGGARAALLVAAAWTGAELLRGRLFNGSPLFVGNPWALLGYSQADFLPMLQAADLAGVYGVTFPIAAVNAGLALAWRAARERRPAPDIMRTIFVSALPALIALGYGAFRLSTAETPAPGSGIQIAAVQGNVDVGTVWSREHYGENLDIYLELTREALKAPSDGAGRRPQIVVWPESAATFFLDEEPRYRARIARVLPASTELLVGTPRSPVAGKPPYFNSVYLLTAEGRLAARYDKQLLVPFAEYFPLGGISFLKRRFARVREFAPGPANAAIPTRAGPAGVLTCNEAMLPEVASLRVEAGATWLVSPSNDTWVPNRDFAELQFDIVALRAIEQRRYLVRASTSGPSAIVSPTGRVLARTEALARGFAASEIQPLTERTVYSRIGDAFGMGCIGVTLVGVAASRRQRRGR